LALWLVCSIVLAINQFMPWLSLQLCALSILLILSMTWQIMRTIKRQHSLSARQLALYLAHCGFALTAIGGAVVSHFGYDKTLFLGHHEGHIIYPYRLELKDSKIVSGPNYFSQMAWIEIRDVKTNQILTTLAPEQRYYPIEKNQTTESTILSRWWGDLYLTIGEPDNSKKRISTHIMIRPGIHLVWIGAALMTIGALCALINKRRTASTYPVRK
jgi:cytochrome c biogenesis factor